MIAKAISGEPFPVKGVVVYATKTVVVTTVLFYIIHPDLEKGN